MKTNGGKRPEEILAEIDHTRDEMHRTLSAIEHRLTPGQLVDQGMDYLRHSGATEFAQNLGGAAKQNPLPVALAAIGIGWLMALGRQPAQGNGSSMSASGLRESASGVLEGASSGMNAMRDRASSVADATRQQWDRARGGLDYMVREQPLVLGAIGLAVGAVVAAMAPRTQKEEELLGEASRNVIDKAKETGSQQLERAQQTAKQAVEKVKGDGQKGDSQTPPRPGAAQGPNPQAPKPQKGGW